MKKELHLNVFDFDETLFRVPSYVSSEAVGMEPYEWFDSPISLNEKFPIRGIANTIDKASENCHNFLITHRVPACKDEIIRLLEKHSISFDKIYYLGRGSTKSQVVIDNLEFLDVKSVTIFEDSLWEIIQYTQDFLDKTLEIQIEFMFIDKSRVIKIDWQTACELVKNISIERLKLV